MAFGNYGDAMTHGFSVEKRPSPPQNREFLQRPGRLGCFRRRVSSPLEPDEGAQVCNISLGLGHWGKSEYKPGPKSQKHTQPADLNWPNSI
ncbi:hypothetical protein SLEP1_g48550 [Rubroshorea leprosula]|uniref:Uncharacterized protein n=1 Tax=Rubroshorea leprosula TaxID=152421 RepID=A0AAV5LUW7_9ROSI|nr:hypothetical protein SLEP1_g48550 [Rubroshorea leprosula]